jgi:hypothetical protein
MSHSADRPNRNFEAYAPTLIRLIDQIFETARTLIKFSAPVFGLLIVRGMIHDLAGRYTFADIAIKFLGDFKISETLAYFFGAGALVYGKQQRQLRKKKIEELSSM